MWRFSFPWRTSLAQDKRLLSNCQCRFFGSCSLPGSSAVCPQKSMGLSLGHFESGKCVTAENRSNKENLKKYNFGAVGRYTLTGKNVTFCARSYPFKVCQSVTSILTCAVLTLTSIKRVARSGRVSLGGIADPPAPVRRPWTAPRPRESPASGVAVSPPPGGVATR